ncbi:MAG: LptF/LptG family permease, partial [Alphaproteobacteria bacterium]|nr:LptF/LptG family permease [Alphaproteobacteria bacterium]
VLGVVIVTASLSMLIWLTQSLRFVELILNKGLSVTSFISLTMLLLPSFLVIIMPIAIFAVVLFVYNKLITDRELVVMRATGMSQLNIAFPAILLAVLLTVLNFAFTLDIVPKSVLKFREMRWTIQHDVSHLLLQEGEFNHVAKGLTVYIRKRESDGTLLGILVHDSRDIKKKVTMMAERGRLVYTIKGPHVNMTNGNRQEISGEDSKFSILYFDSYTMDFGTLDSGGNRFKDARERTLNNLLTMEKTPEFLDVDIRRFRVEAHKRLTLPLYNIVFAMIGIAGLLSGTFNRQGQTLRVIGTIAAVVIVQAASLGAENIATKNLSMIPLIYINVFIPLIAAFLYLFRPFQWKKDEHLSSAQRRSIIRNKGKC